MATFSPLPSTSMSIANATRRGTSCGVLPLLLFHPRQPAWSQWHARAVTFFESWQIWLQYFSLSGAIQLQAGFAHFFAPAIPVPPWLHPAVFTKNRTRL